jgi:hypothetical protein
MCLACRGGGGAASCRGGFRTQHKAMCLACSRGGGPQHIPGWGKHTGVVSNTKVCVSTQPPTSPEESTVHAVATDRTFAASVKVCSLVCLQVLCWLPVTAGATWYFFLVSWFLGILSSADLSHPASVADGAAVWHPVVPCCHSNVRQHAGEGSAAAAGATSPSPVPAASGTKARGSPAPGSKRD